MITHYCTCVMNLFVNFRRYEVIVASQEAVKNQSLVGIPSGIYGKNLNYNLTNDHGYVTLVVSTSLSFHRS